jgi:hypothetical protein
MLSRPHRYKFSDFYMLSLFSKNKVLSCQLSNPNINKPKRIQGRAELKRKKTINYKGKYQRNEINIDSRYYSDRKVIDIRRE